jgi:phosphoglycerol transferase MdoB-like AlkP superfamily enzyme
MRERLRILGSLGLFWLSYQIVVRAIFLLYNHSFSSQLTPKDVVLVFLNGLKMDISICGYYLMLSGIILTISVFVQSKWIRRSLNILTSIILFLSSLIVAVDLELYRHWGFRLNTSPLLYVGSEAIGSVDAIVLIELVTIFLLVFSFSLLIYLKTISRSIKHIPSTTKSAFGPLLIVTALMFIPIRGSFTVAPMNTGFVYFHKTKAFANHSAINVSWNFFNSVRKSANISYDENFYNKDIAKQKFDSLYVTTDTTSYQLFNTKRPNVIVFILESFTADVLEPLGGLKGVAPNMNRLCKEGVLFDNFYASGDRTDKGIVSILSGYPAQPLTSIIKSPSKSQRLPYLNEEMLKLGYQTSFIYGGDIDFANFRSYLTKHGFDNITTEDDFDDDDNTSKWGVHDHIMLERAFAECDTASSPFFKVILTLSSHEPFDVPMTSDFIHEYKGEEGLFLNSCHYTDSTIGVFIDKAKKTDWWKSSVIILVADHGHRQPGNKEAKDKERFKIPLLMIGGAVKKDTVIHTFGGQTDIVNTLLGQLATPSDDFKFSKDMLNKDVKSFAAYFFNDGYGFLTPDSYIIYDNPGKQFLKSVGATHKEHELSKAYQQILYSDYNKR